MFRKLLVTRWDDALESRSQFELDAFVVAIKALNDYVVAGGTQLTFRRCQQFLAECPFLLII